MYKRGRTATRSASRPARSRTPSRSRSLSRRVNNVAKKVRLISKADPVFVTNSGSNTSVVNATPEYLHLNGIQQGDTQLTRDGVKVNWKSLTIKVIWAAGAALVAPTWFRFIIVRENSCLGSAPTAQQIFNDSTPDALSRYNVTNRDFKGRYTVYYDSGPQTIGNYITDYTAAAGYNGGGCKSLRAFSKKIKFNFTTDYSRGNAGTVADIDTNSLYMIAFSDSATASAVGVYYSWTLYGNDN